MEGVNTPSLGGKIQCGCPICSGSEQPHCLRYFGMQVQKNGQHHNILEETTTKVLNSALFPSIMKFEWGTWRLFWSGSWGICVISGLKHQFPIRQPVTRSEGVLTGLSAIKQWLKSRRSRVHYPHNCSLAFPFIQTFRCLLVILQRYNIQGG